MKALQTLVAVWIAAFAPIANAANPTVEEIKVAVENDERFTELFTEVWVLRDLLALQQGGDISAQMADFQRLQDQLTEDRSSMLEQLSNKPLAVDLPENYQLTGNAIAEKLDVFGVRRDSELARRLMSGYLIFSQLLLLDNQAPLCDIHPFRPFC